MTQNEIMEMARQAWGASHEIFWFDDWFDDDGIEAFAKLVAAKEREACAKLVEVPDDWDDWEVSCGEQGRELCNDLAKAIRAMGEV